MRNRKLHKRRKTSVKHALLFSLLFFGFLITGYSAFQTVVSINAKGHVIFDERCVVGNVFNFEQKDEIQEFIVPCSGTYKLEIWGAQGGNHEFGDGGMGGYSIGDINLTRNKKLYIVIGEQGESNNDSDGGKGGYNGGGSGGIGLRSWGCRGGAGGGGATHISIENNRGELYNYKNYIDELLIVAGAGGGATGGGNILDRYSAGAGGGFVGNDSIPVSAHGVVSVGASQDDGYLFGKGQNGSNGFNKNYAAEGNGGAGGGYYGGFTSQKTGEDSNSAGSGGSGYIGNNLLSNKSMYCYDCEESLDLTKPEIFTVSTTGTSSYRDTINCPDGYSENPISKCAKKGDGYARITLISRK